MARATCPWLWHSETAGCRHRSSDELARTTAAFQVLGYTTLLRSGCAWKKREEGPLGSAPGLVQDSLLTKRVQEPTKSFPGALGHLVNGQEEGCQDCTLLGAGPKSSHLPLRGALSDPEIGGDRTLEVALTRVFLGDKLNVSLQAAHLFWS